MPYSQSPVSCLPFGPALTTSGLLALSPGEVELITRSRIEIRLLSTEPNLPTEEDWSRFRDYQVIGTVTTHRIVFLKKKERTRQIHLETINYLKGEGGPTWLHPRSSYKIQIGTMNCGFFILVFKIPEDWDQARRDRDEILTQIQKSLRRKLWLEDRRLEEKQKLENQRRQNSLNKRVGVGAVIDRNLERHREAKEITSRVFGDESAQDIEVFVREAKDLMKVINKYVATLERKQKQEEGEDVDEDEKQLTTMLNDMGIASALSKNRLGDLYHQHLARQLCDFLKVSYKNWTGIMTLTDLYCLFNRARGTNLISPDDLLIALDVAKKIKLGISKKEFPSGVVVVQDDAFSEGNMDKTLLEFASSQKQGITALDVSHEQTISSILAVELLHSAERRGVVCRDVTLEGTRFFPNRFGTGEFGV